MGPPSVNELRALVLESHVASEPKLNSALRRVSADLQHLLERTPTSAHSAFVSASNSLHRIRGTSNADTRLKCLLSCVHFFYNEGRPFDAFQPALDHVALARAVAIQRECRIGLTILGVLYADTGNLAKAIEQYAEALAIARSIEDDKGECIVLINMGVALMYGSQFTEAMACNNRALYIASRNPSLLGFQFDAALNSANCYLLSGDIERGLRAARRGTSSLGHLETSEDALKYVLHEHVLAQLQIESGNARGVVLRLPLLKQAVSRANSIRASVLGATIEGMCEVESGNSSRGISILETALAKSANLSSVYVDCLIALVKALDSAGQPERALAYLKTLQDHIRTIRAGSLLRHLDLRETGANLESSDERWYLTNSDNAREANLRAKIAERELVRSRFEMLERLAVTADLREDASGEHGYRVGRLAALLAEEMGWKPQACEALDLAARLHDIGKVGVPDRILLESAALKEAERKVMSSHTVIGSELLSKSNVAEIRMAEEIAHCHHERWDGTGYPAGLKAKRIPAGARITALADVFDAMTHGRPYAQAWPVEVALDKIAALGGTQFDPDMTERFIPLVRRLRDEHEDLDAYLGRAAKSSPFLQARSRIRQMLSQGRLEDGTSAPDPSSTLH
jgi:putative two-component system response regulator